jgi:prepilin-type N-terminal cleavage/methylation domain-containing protein
VCVRGAGFSLLEIVVAIGIVAVVATMAGLVIHALGVGHATLTRATQAHDREMNGWRTLRALAGGAELRVSGEDQFQGSESAISIPTWCMSPGGWVERCLASVAIASDAGEGRVRVLPGKGAAFDVPLVTRGATPVFRFIRTSHDRLDWAPRWSSTSTLPSAVAIVAGRDTIVLRIGERG